MKRLSTTKIIALVYLIIILIGGTLLCLPVASKSGNVTNFLDACFTATSSTCVTGLSVFSTGEYWSLFGQVVILCLIQIGGVGFMTFGVIAVTALKKRLSISGKRLMQESVAAPTMGQVVNLTRVIVFGTLAFELLGACFYSFFFIPELGVLKGIFYSVFHSVSAFCNAGFDLMAYTGQESLIAVQGNIYFNIITMALIIIGGLGFFVWVDLWQSKFRFSKMKLHTKIVVSVSLILTLLGAIFIFLCEFSSNSELTTGRLVLVSMFQSVTARTAGFESVNIANMTHGTQMILIALMLVGGSPGSTAGGFKTTIVGIIFFNIKSTFKRKKEVEGFGRTIPSTIVRTAFTILTMYILLSVSFGVVISVMDGIPIITALFETSSAIATVGLTLDATPDLCSASQLILMLLMYFGRVGPLTIFMAFSPEKFSNTGKLPHEEVRVG